MTIIPRETIIIEIQGGCLSGVYSTKPKDVKVELVDWDNVEAGERGPVSTVRLLMTPDNRVY